mmetsp:Transcript_60676/g.169582  ORF Transcript_60676/g.169582 Transcript_60676/m.169582 type:complete len:214 (+) Transcript_60676:302-943(+)
MLDFRPVGARGIHGREASDPCCRFRVETPAASVALVLRREGACRDRFQRQAAGSDRCGCVRRHRGGPAAPHRHALCDRRGAPRKVQGSTELGFSIDVYVRETLLNTLARHWNCHGAFARRGRSGVPAQPYAHPGRVLWHLRSIAGVLSETFERGSTGATRRKTGHAAFRRVLGVAVGFDGSSGERQEQKQTARSFHAFVPEHLAAEYRLARGG